MSSLKVIRKRFSTDGNSPLKALPEFVANIQSFDKILKDSNLIFVDKSLLIKDILQEDTVLLTRPRRWGKSLNMQMIESFFQPTFSPEGMIIEDKIKKKKFSMMMIGSEKIPKNPFTKEIKETAIIDLQGTVPVVDLTFNIPLHKNIVGIHESFVAPLIAVIEKHKYLLKSKKVIGTSKEELFKKILKEDYGEITSYDIRNTLHYLVKALKDHHGKQPILLIDEYDNTLLRLKVEGNDLYNYGLALFKDMFSIIKNQNQLVQIAVFTGVTRIIKEDIFSGLNSIRYDSVQDSDYIEHFGFTEKDIDYLLDKVAALYKKEFNKTILKEKIAFWYDGYRINDRMVYNPFSVMNCLHSLIKEHKRPFKTYWANSGDPFLLVNALETVPTKPHIDTLFKTDMVKFTPQDGADLKNISSNENAFLTMMLDSGYLTEGDEDLVYKIPNNEVRYELYNKFYRTWLKRQGGNLFEVIIQPEEFENPEIFLKVFQEKVLPSFKGEDNPEYFFQNFLYTSLNKKGLHAILEKKTDDSKRIDIVIVPDEKLDNKNDTVYIVEIKMHTKKSKKFALNQGLNQIFAKNYAANELIKDNSLKKFILRVVSFGYNENSELEITMTELRFTRENLLQAIDLFFLNNEKGKEKKNLFEELLHLSFSSFISKDNLD